ncbi:MAG: ABC transporter permease [Spirochaetes bacterium]|nr:ABC transporter permease [Spirochaetota bacterium]
MNTNLAKGKELLSRHSSLVTFVVLIFVLGVLTQGRVLSWDSIRSLLIAESSRAFAALGVGMIIITRGIDLSVGAVVSLSASVAASFAQDPGLATAIFPGISFPLFVPVLAGITVGALCGLFNGVLVAYGKLPAFIATLGTMVIARGLQLIYTRAAIVSSLTAPYRAIAQTTLGENIRFPILGIYMIVITGAVWILMRHTRQGSNFYAIGGNVNAARVSGINVEKNLVCVYLYAGILYGIAGVLISSRLALANALTASGMELDAIAAVTVGGISHSGGVGTVGGMIVGLFTMGLIRFGMSFMAINPHFQLLVQGIIIILAVYFDMKKNAKRL